MQSSETKTAPRGNRFKVPPPVSAPEPTRRKPSATHRAENPGSAGNISKLAKSAKSARNRIKSLWYSIAWKRLRILSGVVLIVAGIFMVLACLSHFFYGRADQSILEQHHAFQTATIRPVRNLMGLGGAWIASQIITYGFGILGILIPFYVVLVGSAILTAKVSGLVSRIFSYLLFGLYWGAGMMAFVAQSAGIGSLEIGGSVGHSLVDWLSVYIGLPGTGMLLGVILFGILVLRYNSQSEFVQRLGAWVDGTINTAVDPASKNELTAEPIPEGGVADSETDEHFKVVRKPPPAASQTNLSKTDSNLHSHAATGGNYSIEPIEGSAAAQSFRNTPEHEIESTGISTHTDGDSKNANVDPAIGGNIGFDTDTETVYRDDFVPDEYLTVENRPVQIEVIIPQAEELISGGSVVDEIAVTVPNVTAITQSRLGKAVTNPSATHVNVGDAVDDQDLIDLPIESVYQNIIRTQDDELEKEISTQDQPLLPEEESVGDWEPYNPKEELSQYKYPTIELLELRSTPGGRELNEAELKANQDLIIKTLLDFNIKISDIRATIGPTVTLYEVIPAPGVRISKIKSLEDDIALNLKALGIRIIAPVPGKGTIGIEIPNSKPEIVSFRSVIATERFKHNTFELPVALGKTIANEVFIADLATMPHLLVAGATGMGKSVGLNGIIASLLYKMHPAQVKFVLIDPKKVEMSLYQMLDKHFLARLPGSEDAIITENDQVKYVLQSLCIEMEQRYQLLKDAKVKKITEYNQKFTDRRLNPKKGHRFLPYIVVVIDELADLMMTSGKEIELPICRLAQLARAIGIHLIIATQRPSVNVITGLIKANFPARMSFRVTQRNDSRTILDANGAEQLLGRGDMLFLASSSAPIRLQNAFLDTPEVERIVESISKQRGYATPYWLPEVPIADTNHESSDEINGNTGRDNTRRDPMLADAGRLVVRTQNGSTSFLQRRLELGYSRAARIMEQLEALGIVGPARGSKPRDVFISDEISLENILQHL